MTHLFILIRRVEAAVLSASILAIAALIVLNVLVRALTGASLAATGEICQFLIVLVTFAGLSHAAGYGRHIRMTAFHDLLGLKWRKRLTVFVSIFSALLLFLLAVFAARYVLVIHRLGSESPVLQAPLYLVYLCAPVGLVAAGLQYLLAAVKNLRNEDAYLSFDTKDEYGESTGGGV